jgi:hypothetical protein
MLAAFARIALLCCSAVFLCQDPIPPNIYGTCLGTYVQATGQLRCTPQDCAPGCRKMEVATPFGPGKICVCNYIGPQPFCCTIALTDIGSYMAFGQCGGYCPSGQVCSTMPGGTAGTTIARCVL